MVCPSDSHTRNTLEQLYRRSPSVSLSRLMLGFAKQVGAAMAATLTRDSHDPHISRYYDIYGRLIWSAYDPRTKQTFVTRSEMELRAWLDARYYGQSDVSSGPSLDEHWSLF